MTDSTEEPFLLRPLGGTGNVSPADPAGSVELRTLQAQNHGGITGEPRDPREDLAYRTAGSGRTLQNVDVVVDVVIDGVSFVYGSISPWLPSAILT